MRWPHPILALVICTLGACGIFQPASGAAAAGGTAGSDAGADCDTAGDCSDCEACAVGSNGPCFTAFSACEMDPDCSSIDQCVAVGDTLSDCEANNPSGVSLYTSAATCEYCMACP